MTNLSHFSYPIHCTEPDCDHLAQFKIAARWSDGVTEELKTVALTCEHCLAKVFLEGRERQRTTRLNKHETLGETAIFEMEKETRSQNLKRRSDLEEEILRHSAHSG